MSDQAMEAVAAEPAERVSPEPFVAEIDTTSRVLVVRASTVAEADELAPALATVAREQGQSVLLLVGAVRLEALDEDQMRAAGWVRAETLKAETAEQLARVISP